VRVSRLSVALACADRKGSLIGDCRTEEIQQRRKMSWHASDVLLIFDILLDDCERCATHGADEIAVRPKCWQAWSQHLKVLPKHPRCPTLDAPHQPMDAELRIAVEQQVHMIWHHSFTFRSGQIGFRRTRPGSVPANGRLSAARKQHVPVRSEFRHRTLYIKALYNNPEVLTP
jgi:hypothetical protein